MAIKYGPPAKTGEVLYVVRILVNEEWIPILSRWIGGGYEAVEIPLRTNVSVLCACCRPKRGKWATFKKDPKNRDRLYFKFSFSGLPNMFLVEDFLSQHSLVKVRIQEKMK